MGPTGSGKSAVAEYLADALEAQLLNADAFQVYRGLDIGTNKPVDKDRYRLLDLVEPTEEFGAGQWVGLAVHELNDCWEKGRSVVVVGGTGYYIRALFEQYGDMAPAPEPSLREAVRSVEREQGLTGLVQWLLQLEPETAVDQRNPARVRRAIERSLTPKVRIQISLPPFSTVKLGLLPDVTPLDEALEDRVRRMLDGGWPEEVRNLLEGGVPITSPGFRAIGYQSVAGFLLGRLSRLETEEAVFRTTRRYAKRQRTWLRSEPRLRALPMTQLTDESIRQVADSALSIVFGRGD